MDYISTTSMDTSSNDTALRGIPSKPSAVEAIIMYLLCSGAFFSNILVFMVLPRLKGKIRTPTRYCMISLVVTDSAIGIVCLITRTIFIADTEFYIDNICHLEGISVSFLIAMTVIGLTLLNIDRVLVIIIPTKYDPWITSKKCLLILVLLWLGCIIRYIIAVQWQSGVESTYLEGSYVCAMKYDAKSSFTISGIVILLVLPFLDCVAALAAMAVFIRRQRERGTQKVNLKMKESATVLSTIFLLSAFYFLMTAPFCICVLIWQTIKGHALSPTANFITTWLLACNSVVNPYIYLATMKSYRREFFNIVSKFIRVKRKTTPAIDDSRLSTHDDVSL